MNYQDMWKRTPLHYAAREGQIEACQRLVELGGDLTAQDILGRTPLHLAARKGHADLVVILANLGSDLDHADRNPWPNNSERTPLHWACYKGRAEVVLRLCELGANKEAVDAMKRTPLHWAARRGQTDCVQVLLVLGANLHAVDSKQMKPVNLANSKESNSATQKMLHQATVRKVLPTGLPSFPPQPVPAVNLHADGSAGIYAQEADAPDMTPAAARRTTPRQVAATTPASTASPDTYAARKAAATAARISAAKAASPGAGHGGGVREPGSGNDDLAAAVARARAQYQAQSPAAGGMGAEDLIDGGNKAAGGWAAEGGNRKFKTAMGEDQDLRYIREDIGSSCVCVCARARLFAPNPSRFRYAGFVAGRHAILSDFSVDLLHYVPYFLLRVCLVVNGRS